MINETLIKQQIGDLIDATDNSDITRLQARQVFIDKLSSIIVDAIKSATITLTPGDIKVVGSQTAQQNVIPLVLNNKLS